MTIPEDVMVCAVCRQPLNKIVSLDDGSTLGWEHSRPHAAGPAHNVQPILASTVAHEVVAVCDFCSAPAPAWTYPATDFRMAEPWGSISGWAACDTCHDLVEAEDWETLAERGADTARGPVSRVVRRQLVKHARELHQEFVAHRTGPAYRH